jgi:hypothetical protein
LKLSLQRRDDAASPLKEGNLNMAAAMMQMLLASGAAGGGGGGGSPPISGLVGWWDASVFASLTLSGSNITAVADQSGHSQDLTASGSPTYNATGLNSKPVMVLPGGSVGFDKASFPLGTGSSLTVFFVGYMDSGTGDFGRLISYKGGGTNDTNNDASFFLGRWGTNNAVDLYRNSQQAIQNVSLSTPFRCISTVSSFGDLRTYVNGVVGGLTGTENASWGSPGALAIGWGVDHSSSWHGGISELGIATAFTNSTDVATLDTYLKTKWGL